jgi:uncharacterized protein (DUF885 family)
MPRHLLRTPSLRVLSLCVPLALGCASTPARAPAAADATREAPPEAPTPAAPATPATPAAATPDAGAAAAAQVTALADAYMAGLLERSPELVTYYGLPGGRHDRLQDNSLDAERAWAAREDAWWEEVQRVDARALQGRPEAVLLGVLVETLGSSRQGRVCRGELWPVSQMSGWQVGLPFLAQLQPVGTPELHAQALARFGQLPRYLATQEANLRQGLAEGYSSPKLSVERVLAQLDGMLASSAPEKSPFFSPAERAKDPAFRAALARLLRAELTPAIRRHRDFLRKEYLPRAREAVPVSALPQGEACYRALVRSYTTLDLAPKQVHETGLREMERIQAEMKAIAERSFQTKDVPRLLARLREDPRYTFGSREEMLAAARDAVARAKAKMPEAFGILPRADVVVEPYPAFQERSAPGGEYNNPAEDGSRPGIYRLNTYQPRKQARAPVQSTAFHEAIPGHHLQSTIAQERPGTHALQRFLFTSGFVEGWALYAERLAEELGLFSTDLDRMGLLSNEALRAARLVVDPGLHVLGWSRQQAIDYMQRHTAESPEAVATEVDRYIVWPGQATAYMLGRNELLLLREQARRALGERFDLRAFHDRVLEDGNVTLPQLRAKVEAWLASEQAQHPPQPQPQQGRP